MKLEQIKEIEKLTTAIKDASQEVYITWREWEKTKDNAKYGEYINKYNAFNWRIKEFNEYVENI